MSRVTLFECNKCSIREDKGNCSEWHIDKNDFSLCEVCVRSITRASSGAPVTPLETGVCNMSHCYKTTLSGYSYCNTCFGLTKC